MSLDDWARADCTRYREPPIDMDAVMEQLEAAVVEAWAKNEDPEEAMKAAIQTSPEVTKIARKVEADRAFRAAAEKKRLERVKAAKKRAAAKKKEAARKEAEARVAAKKAKEEEARKALVEAKQAEETAAREREAKKVAVEKTLESLEGRVDDLATLAEALEDWKPPEPVVEETRALVPHQPSRWDRLRLLFARVVDLLHWEIW